MTRAHILTPPNADVWHLVPNSVELTSKVTSSAPNELLYATKPDAWQVRFPSHFLFVIKPDVCQLCELGREIRIDFSCW